MILDKETIFDESVVITLYDDKLYVEKICRLLSGEKWPDCIDGEPKGIIVFKHTGINGRCMFCVDKTMIHPIFKVDDTYFIEPFVIYDDIKSQNLLSKEETDAIDESVDFVIKAIVKGGSLVPDGV